MEKYKYPGSKFCILIRKWGKQSENLKERSESIKGTPCKCRWGWWRRRRERSSKRGRFFEAGCDGVHTSFVSLKNGGDHSALKHDDDDEVMVSLLKLGVKRFMRFSIRE